jgi:hypothetical protein
MNCPVHTHVQLRIEYPRDGGRTGYCAMCARHYPLCMRVRFMESCDREKNHSPPHRTAHGVEWKD